MALVSWNKAEPKLESYEVRLRASGDTVFANLVDSEKPEAPYVWALLKKESDHFIVWRSDPAKIKELVQSHKLNGRISGDERILDKLPTGQMALITAAKVEGSLFDWSDPVALMRVAKE